MKIPDKILARLKHYYDEYAAVQEEAKYTPDGFMYARPRLNYLRNAIDCAKSDAVKWLLMEDKGDYVEVHMIRDPQHAYELHQELARQSNEWLKTQ